MGLSNRLKERREQLGLTQSEVATLLGITPGAIGNYENGVSTPRADVLFKVFDALKCDANYLFQDEMSKHSHEDNATPLEMEHLVKRYRALDMHGKEMVDFTLKKEYERIKKYGKLSDVSDKISQFPKRLISYYFKNASAGTGQLIIDNLPDARIEIPDKPEYKNVSYAISVNGSSMEPAFHDGDILLVEATREIEVGDIGIFQIDNECFVKKLGDTALISLNKDYKDIPLNETAITLGKVIDKLNS